MTEEINEIAPFFRQGDDDHGRSQIWYEQHLEYDDR